MSLSQRQTLFVEIEDLLKLSLLRSCFGSFVDVEERRSFAQYETNSQKVSQGFAFDTYTMGLWLDAIVGQDGGLRILFIP